MTALAKSRYDSILAKLWIVSKAEFQAFLDKRMTSGN
jgi:hypothetical protein